MLAFSMATTSAKDALVPSRERPVGGDGLCWACHPSGFMPRSVWISIAPRVYWCGHITVHVRE